MFWFSSGAFLKSGNYWCAPVRILVWVVFLLVGTFYLPLRPSHKQTKKSKAIKAYILKKWWVDSGLQLLKNSAHQFFNKKRPCNQFTWSQNQTRRGGIRWAKYWVRENSWWLLCSRFQKSSSQLSDIPFAVQRWQIDSAFHITFGHVQIFLWKLQSPRNSVTWNLYPWFVKGFPAIRAAFPRSGCPKGSVVGNRP